LRSYNLSPLPCRGRAREGVESLSRLFIFFPLSNSLPFYKLRTPATREKATSVKTSIYFYYGANLKHGLRSTPQ